MEGSFALKFLTVFVGLPLVSVATIGICWTFLLLWNWNWIVGAVLLLAGLAALVASTDSDNYGRD